MKYFVVSLLLLLLVITGIYIKTQEPEQRIGPSGYLGIDIGGGQLGNQMFDIAAGMAYAWDHALTPVIISLDKEVNNWAHNREQVFFRLDTEKKSPVVLTPYRVSNPCFAKLPANLNNVLLEGGFFSWKYFDHYRDKIIDLFAPSTAIQEKLQKKYGSLIASDKTVSVHVRTFSKKLHEEGCHFVGLDFFEEAIAQFPKDSIFVLFSDRINWTKAHFQEKFPHKNLVFIEGNDYIEDMYLMSRMKNHIVSRSTFSWWAAYLNRHPTKRVFVPIIKEQGLRGFLKPYGKTILSFFGKTFWWDEYFWLPEWNKMYYTPKPYPEDIYNFADETTSVYPLDK